MIGRYYAPTVLFVAFCVLIVSVTVGADHGFEATSVEDTRITPDEYETDREGADGSDWAQDFADYVVDLAMSFASFVAVIVYKNQGWMSPTWTATILEGVSYLGFAVFFGWNLLHVKSLLSGVRSA